MVPFICQNLNPLTEGFDLYKFGEIVPKKNLKMSKILRRTERCHIVNFEFIEYIQNLQYDKDTKQQTQLSELKN